MVDGPHHHLLLITIRRQSLLSTPASLLLGRREERGERRLLGQGFGVGSEEQGLEVYRPPPSLTC